MIKSPRPSSPLVPLVLQDESATYGLPSSEIDLSLLKDSLAKTPWERMQANDDALNFGESLRVAMARRRA